MLLQWAEDDDSQADQGAQVETSHGRRKRTLVTVDTFHSYVRPTWRPQLSDFCISLTGIQQVSYSLPVCELTAGRHRRVPDVSGGSAPVRGMARLLGAAGRGDGRARRRDVGDGRPVGPPVSARLRIPQTDSARDFIPKQLHMTPTDPPYPPYLLGRYLNLKNAVATYLADRDSGRRVTTGRVHRTPKDKEGPRSLNIPAMLDVLELGSFNGRQHSGIDVSGRH